ncbi:unnamed protein product [Oppiella nova]|uniref:Uncharacterized protein n=1 Tax=Oppiella nova TaxID=334625 RepID=A0A7R9MBE3_9ACAR|nr:unnamed protein product [Oppiella nova]CAG2173746.1 unnamed protein product [Oppiella nova]
MKLVSLNSTHRSDYRLKVQQIYTRHHIQSHLLGRRVINIFYNICTCLGFTSMYAGIVAFTELHIGFTNKLNPHSDYSKDY